MVGEKVRSWRYWPTTIFTLVSFGAFEISFVVQGVSDVRNSVHHGSWIGRVIFWVPLVGAGAIVLARIAMSSLLISDKKFVVVNLLRTLRVDPADVAAVDVVDRGRRLRSVALEVGGHRRIMCDGLTSLAFGRKGAGAMFAEVVATAKHHIDPTRDSRRDGPGP
jgi:hypothetical protein